MTIVLILLGFLFVLVGLVGCILPAIPGPPLSFVGLIILSHARDWEPFSLMFLLVMAGFMVCVTALDYLAPALWARKYGASKLGMWCSILGMAVGLFLFPPLGILLGAFVGAMAGEFTARREGGKVLRAGWGIFVGNVVSTGLKLAFSGVVLLYYVKEMF